MSNDNIVKDLGALYVALCYTYTTVDLRKGKLQAAYDLLKDLYMEEAKEAFPEEILEPMMNCEITTDMLFACYDALEDSLNYTELSKLDKKAHKTVSSLVTHVRGLAQDMQDADFLTCNSKATGAIMPTNDATKLVQDFLNGAWIKSLMIQRHGMLRNSSGGVAETYGIYSKRKKNAEACLEDSKSYSYMNRTNALSGWFAKELGNYSTYLKGLAGAADSEQTDNVSFIADLLSGIASAEDAATERDWAEGKAVTVTFTGVNLPGVALHVEPIQFSVTETKYMASQIAALNELANKAEGICVTPDSLLFGKDIKVDMTAIHAKFSNKKEFKQYDLSLVNIDRPAQELVEQIKGVLSKPEDERPSLVTGLFYGVPGSGKSMLADYIGDQLGRPVLKKTYAELQSMYVGEGEKQLSEAFAEAEAEGAILLIDELDSIAGNRKNADKNYQKTFVNQLLTELDEFKGIFLATSNFMDGLDPAVLRRLFLKVKFEFLEEDQIETAFQLYFPKLKRSKLGFIPYLTPGDFRAVKEAAQFDVAKLTVKRVRELLNSEIELKKLTLGEVITEEKTVGYHL